ncbi:MAG: ATP-binding cassette domain-containing protein [Oscillospiraceae bacterium]|jgi:putative ABC transport system ATP-binding protein|nr:ATP-binding cassette domain-containing protein [Oscillospiraceae bacterium]MDD3260754.1 ATP-binding cassette domain-containing protein [Oscillospiraceae bacterium]
MSSQSTAAASEPLVRMQHIYKTFNPGSVNEVVLFQNFNLQIEKGSFVAVVGSNGSGKTTILNLLCGSIPVDSGSIFLKKRDITKLKEHTRSRFIGRVFQDPAMGTCPSLTVLENMALADNKGGSFLLQPGINRRRADYYKQELSLLHMGLEDKLGVQVGSLSGGQRQALALLIATMTPIDLLILDEHTAALDPSSSNNVMELTQRVAEEKHVTMLMVTHNLKFAVAYGDRLIMMHRGNIILDAAGEKKKALDVHDLTNRFDEISVEDGN